MVLGSTVTEDCISFCLALNAALMSSRLDRTARRIKQKRAKIRYATRLVSNFGPWNKIYGATPKIVGLQRYKKNEAIPMMHAKHICMDMGLFAMLPPYITIIKKSICRAKIASPIVHEF